MRETHIFSEYEKYGGIRIAELRPIPDATDYDVDAAINCDI